MKNKRIVILFLFIIMFVIMTFTACSKEPPETVVETFGNPDIGHGQKVVIEEGEKALTAEKKIVEPIPGGASCIYSEGEGDQKRCFQGNCLDGSNACGYNENCGFVSGYSSGKEIACPELTAVEKPVATTTPGAMTPKVKVGVSEKPSVSRLSPITMTRSTALKITIGMFVILVFAVVLLESEHVDPKWSFAAIGWTSVCGVLIPHIWMVILPPILRQVRVTGDLRLVITLGCLILLALSAWAARSESVSAKMDMLGYLGILLVGAALHQIWGWYSIIPIIIS